MTTSLWISLVPKIIEKAPTIAKALGKEWIFQEARAAHPQSTSPNGASPVVAMLIEMANRGDDESLSCADKVFAKALAAGSKRITELKEDAALNGGAAWQALAELSFYNALSSDGAAVDYDQTEENKRTPDFRRTIAGEDIGIEHVSPGEGSYLKTKRKEAEDSLSVAREASNLLDEAKKFYEQYKQLPPLSPEEKTKIALASGHQQVAGTVPPTLTDSEILQEIERHEIEEIRSFSAQPYAATRSASRANIVRFLRQVKEGGVQVAECKWKIMALSIPDHMFSHRDIEETVKLVHPKDSTNVRWWSGVVWHALYGEPEKKLYCGIEEHLAQKGIGGRLIEACEGLGLLVNPDEPWHAVVVSIFSTKWHSLRAPGNTRTGGDVLPLNLSPLRVLFLRRQGETLPDKVASELSTILSTKKIFK